MRSSVAKQNPSTFGSLVASYIAVMVAALVAWGGAQGGAMLWEVPIIALCVCLAFLVQWVAFIPAFLKQTEHFYDLAGSLTYLTVTWAAVAATGNYGVRGLVIAALVSVWSIRLGSFLFSRIKADGKDGRFDDIKPNAARFFMTWTLQGLWVSLTLAAALAAITVLEPAPLGILDGVGLLVWVVGFGLEVVADRQKRAFRESNPGEFINVGLWSWSRHPNYFGEITLWVGIAIMAASTVSGWQWVTMISPIFVIFLLMKVSGVPMLEKRADEKWGGQEDYERYKARTSVLVLWPPSKR